MESTEGRGFLSCETEQLLTYVVLFIVYIIDERRQGIQVLSVRTDLTKPNQKGGPTQLEWNNTGELLLVRFGMLVTYSGSSSKLRRPVVDNVPAAVHIFDFPAPQQEFTPRLRSILLHNNPVLNARWNPVRRGSLALCCGTQSIFIWNDKWASETGEEEMAECICVPTRTRIFI